MGVYNSDWLPIRSEGQLMSSARFLNLRLDGADLGQWKMSKGNTVDGNDHIDDLIKYIRRQPSFINSNV